MIMNTNEFYEAALKLLKNGRIPAELIDDAVRRILRIKFELGLFDGRAYTEPGTIKYAIGCPEHLALDLELTRESIVLLENRNDTLPLDSSVRSIAVIGPNADNIRSQFGDWTFLSHPSPKPDEKPKLRSDHAWRHQELAEKRGISVAYHKGCESCTKRRGYGGAVKCASEADIIIAVVGDCLEQTVNTRTGRSDSFRKPAKCWKAEEVRKTTDIILVNGNRYPYHGSPKMQMRCLRPSTQACSGKPPQRSYS